MLESKLIHVSKRGHWPILSHLTRPILTYCLVEYMGIYLEYIQWNCKKNKAKTFKKNVWFFFFTTSATLSRSQFINSFSQNLGNHWKITFFCTQVAISRLISYTEVMKTPINDYELLPSLTNQVEKNMTDLIQPTRNDKMIFNTYVSN